MKEAEIYKEIQHHMDTWSSEPKRAIRLIRKVLASQPSAPTEAASGVETLKAIADKKALERSEGYCKEGDHLHGCPCSDYAEGFVEGYNFNMPATPVPEAPEEIKIAVTNTDPKPDPITYELRTFEDIGNAVTSENLHGFLKDFEASLQSFALLKTIVSASETPEVKVKFPSMTWIDDWKPQSHASTPPTATPEAAKEQGELLQLFIDAIDSTDFHVPECITGLPEGSEKYGEVLDKETLELAEVCVEIVNRYYRPTTTLPASTALNDEGAKAILDKCVEANEGKFLLERASTIITHNGITYQMINRSVALMAMQEFAAQFATLPTPPKE